MIFLCVSWQQFSFLLLPLENEGSVEKNVLWFRLNTSAIPQSRLFASVVQCSPRLFTAVSDSGTLEIVMLVMGHSLIRTLVRLVRSARFARALRCAHSLARSLTHSLPNLWECVIFDAHFQAVLNHSGMAQFSTRRFHIISTHSAA